MRGFGPALTIMATKKEPTQKAFVLRDCAFGNAGAVVELPKDQAELGALHGMLDLSPTAIKAAEKAAA